jgi:hypothetical protein
MNAEMQVLQALDAAQAALRRLAAGPTGDAEETARQALELLRAAPWSMVMRADEADRNGWLAEARQALQQIEQNPDSEEVIEHASGGLWAANELERDLRSLLHAR